MGAVLAEPGGVDAAPAWERRGRDSEILLVHPPLADRLVHGTQGRCRLCGDDEALGIAVDAVAEGRREGLLGGRVVDALAPEILLHLVEERDLAGRVRVAELPRGLADDEDARVLVDDLRRPVCGHEAAGRAGREELVTGKDADAVALAEHLAALAALAVQADVLRADELVEHPLGTGGHQLHQEFVQSLTGIVRSDGDRFSHVTFSFLESREGRSDVI